MKLNSAGLLLLFHRRWPSVSFPTRARSTARCVKLFTRRGLRSLSQSSRSCGGYKTWAQARVNRSCMNGDGGSRVRRRHRL
jgi:hypothetical protein